MKHRPAAQESGILVDNLLTMALQRKSRKRSGIALALLAELGAICSLLSLMSMFAPPCNIVFVCGFSAVVTLFFCWHAQLGNRMHFTMYFLIAGYAVTFVMQRERLATGTLHLMNAIYQTIYMTDWQYFECESSLSPASCTTLMLCMAMMPVLWLLSYAVIRYQNFFLSMLVTFPFIEIGFFFGIVPDHLPMLGLLGFWCGMGAVQLAGAGGRKNGGRSGFMRKKNAFYPIADMPFLLTEHTGLLMALSVLGLALACSFGLEAAHYERPEAFKRLRAQFQQKAATIDWNDLSTLLPGNYPDSSGDEGETASDVIDLSENEDRTFQNISLSRVLFSERPGGRLYLKFATYHVYSDNVWSRLPEDAYKANCFRNCASVGMYPPEFLYPGISELQTAPIELSMQNPDRILVSCVPYGYADDKHIRCRYDEPEAVTSLDYTIFGGTDYETLLREGRYTSRSVAELANSSDFLTRPEIHRMAEGNEQKTVWLPGVWENAEAVKQAGLLDACGYGDFAREHYLELPQTPGMMEIREQFADLLDGFDAGTATPAQTIYRLQLLRERLCSQVDYTLTPGKTPPSRDFVEYFLLENLSGYCTHYASAGVLLSRMAGIPARYCEGYMVDPANVFRLPEEIGSGYYTDILDSNAHAWCEVYIEGFGWVPFEYTFTYFTPPDLTDPEEVPVTETETVTEPVMTEPVTVPVTEPVPTTEATEPEVIPAPEPPQGHGKLMLGILLAAFGVLLVPLAFCAARSLALRRRMRLLKNRETAPETAWKWLLSLLRECHVGMDAHTLAALTESAVTACGRYVPAKELEQAIAAGSKLRYSPHGISDEELQLLMHTAHKLTRKIYKHASAFKRFRLKWIKHYL